MSKSMVATVLKVVFVVLFLSIPIGIFYSGQLRERARLNGGEQMQWYHVVVSISDVEMHEGQISDEWLVSGPFSSESACQTDLQHDTKRKLNPKQGETGDECEQLFTADAFRLRRYTGALPTGGPGGSGL